MVDGLVTQENIQFRVNYFDTNHFSPLEKAYFSVSLIRAHTKRSRRKNKKVVVGVVAKNIFRSRTLDRVPLCESVLLRLDQYAYRHIWIGSADEVKP